MSLPHFCLRSQLNAALSLTSGCVQVLLRMTPGRFHMPSVLYRRDDDHT
jgi:hypothetical protein